MVTLKPQPTKLEVISNIGNFSDATNVSSIVEGYTLV